MQTGKTMYVCLEGTHEELTAITSNWLLDGADAHLRSSVASHCLNVPCWVVELAHKRKDPCISTVRKQSVLPSSSPSSEFRGQASR
ncbi:hypothetical protein M404DRAFT_1003390 [Pisolithus tinctorius Marx 270]|uniref:Uncharacterized protein n=1 Tax=Pisolithus tinctorius Marx 270 TaxID=870435 RepID=A0A0C3IWA5_PISTI|nr:hypothetical protein M404DRAFT_1003390 [Pisolithus tinctorius Marx 270]